MKNIRSQIQHLDCSPERLLFEVKKNLACKPLLRVNAPSKYPPPPPNRQRSPVAPILIYRPPDRKKASL